MPNVMGNKHVIEISDDDLDLTNVDNVNTRINMRNSSGTRINARDNSRPRNDIHISSRTRSNRITGIQDSHNLTSAASTLFINTTSDEYKVNNNRKKQKKS